MHRKRKIVWYTPAKHYKKKEKNMHKMRKIGQRRRPGEKKNRNHKAVDVEREKRREKMKRERGRTVFIGLS